ncbi:cell division septal protein [Xenococcus sp. PCC 7305]|uniref:cell division protein FtsQ/DivIB n=1 Tax=Xenococcus sp. PCC 7305 TaxID=102125 RepID=UPI0002ACE50F|nr:FtsQ-type POTRA domain-containing protein [Xenococcus sp. PCC 7305]ELS01412.1 cell division septal protein [Xenococcus sp. PCC 7305]
MSAFYDPKLQQRIILLQRQNRKRVQIAIWRCLLVSSLIATAIAMILSPYWQIKNSAQISLEEEIMVTKSTIYSLLKLNYPQSLWTISGHQLSNKLKSISPIVDAVVTKQLFPPQVKVRLQERVPVATVSTQGKIGFLDADGVWLDPIYYSHSEENSEENSNFSLPQIKVINFQPKYSETWAEIYRLSAMYPGIKLLELRWNEIDQLYLKTNIGRVYLGSDRSILTEQFQALARFPKLSTQDNLTDIDYLDLSNPKIPFIQQDTRVK